MIALTSEPPSASARRAATVAVAVSLVLFVVLVPFADVPVAHHRMFLAVYESALVMCNLLTCMFLFGQFGVTRVPGVPILAGGYLFSAFMALLHELSFPGLFAPAGLLWANGQTTAWLYFFWYLGFPVTVIGFALSPDRPLARNSAAAARRLTLAVVLCAAAAAALALLAATAGTHFLPKIMHGNADRPAKYAVAWLTWMVTLAALAFLWRRARVSGLHLWVLVVIVVWVCDLAQSAVFNSGRYSLGWYTGRVYGLAASCFLLAVLILESGKLYRRLAELHGAEREQRQLAERRSVELHQLAANLETRVRTRTEELEVSNRTLRRTRDELREAATFGSAAREAERARVARELHDQLGQTLVMLKLKLSAMEAQDPAHGAPDEQQWRAMHQLVDQTIESTRRIATDLRPAVLDVLGLAAATQWLVDNFKQRHRIEVRLRVDPPDLQVAEPRSTVVFRVLQEALTNVARHANANCVEVDITRDGTRLVLRIHDDGRGFDADAPRRADALGLLGMRERAALVDGTLEVRSGMGRGTRVTLSIPVGARPGPAAA